MSSSEAPDLKELLRILPHRYPFLLVDRIVSVEPGKRVVAIKNVTMNEPFFQGHFPGHPIMPGVLLCEAMAQAGGVLVFQTDPERMQRYLVYLAGLDNVKFRRPVVPGDQVRLELEVLKRRAPLWRFKGQAMVGEALAAEAEILVSETEATRG
ncbi:MAG TPA: 3-hydroxyacyl-ACP dehydratase FabZ [Thermodesulfobacteriota bacterium]